MELSYVVFEATFDEDAWTWREHVHEVCKSADVAKKVIEAKGVKVSFTDDGMPYGETVPDGMFEDPVKYITRVYKVRG